MNALTKREQIAAMCLQGMFAADSNLSRHAVSRSLEFADALLKELGAKDSEVESRVMRHNHRMNSHDTTNNAQAVGIARKNSSWRKRNENR